MCEKHRKRRQRERWLREGHVCTVRGCAHPLKSHGMCSTHWNRVVAGRPLEPRGAVIGGVRVCAIDGCKRSERERGLCRVHAVEYPLHLCVVDGCTRGAYARGACYEHYRVWRQVQAMDPNNTCRREGCPNRVYAKGLCHRHWREHRGGK